MHDTEAPESTSEAPALVTQQLSYSAATFLDLPVAIRSDQSPHIHHHIRTQGQYTFSGQNSLGGSAETASDHCSASYSSHPAPEEPVLEDISRQQLRFLLDRYATIMESRSYILLEDTLSPNVTRTVKEGGGGLKSCTFQGRAKVRGELKAS